MSYFIRDTWAYLIALAVVVVGIIVFLVLSTSNGPVTPDNTLAKKWGAENGEMSYNNLWRTVSSGKLERLRIDPYGQATLYFRDDSAARASFPPESADRLAERARTEGTPVSIDPLERSNRGSTWIQLLIPIILVGGGILIFFLWKRSREESHQKDEDTPLPEETFSDVAGCPEAVEEVREFVLFLRDHERFLKLGARMPSGAVLHGPPGTGKTLLARALAGESGVPFFHMAGSEAVNKYVGVGASTVRDLFDRARASEVGAVIFIDEIDALGRKRSGDGEPSSREHDNTLNQLLVELDGFSTHDRIVVLGATNRLDTLDPALLRPGRLSRHIPVLPPNEEGREEILRLYAKDKPLGEGADIPGLARITSGSTGADLAHILNEAAIQAARRGSEEISDADLREGHLRAIAGPERPDHIQDPTELRAIAYHEAGHALCGELLPEHERVERVTIIARGQAAGMAIWGSEDRALHSPEYVRQRMIGVLGGRAAERVVIGTISSGAASDLQQANELARTAIEDWGISRRTGQLLSRSGHSVSDRTRSLVDQEVEEMVADAFEDATRLLREHRAELDALAEALLRDRVLERVDILAAIRPHSRKRPRWTQRVSRISSRLPRRRRTATT